MAKYDAARAIVRECPAAAAGSGWSGPLRRARRSGRRYRSARGTGSLRLELERLPAPWRRARHGVPWLFSATTWPATGQANGSRLDSGVAISRGDVQNMPLLFADWSKKIRQLALSIAQSRPSVVPAEPSRRRSGCLTSWPPSYKASSSCSQATIFLLLSNLDHQIHFAKSHTIVDFWKRFSKIPGCRVRARFRQICQNG